MIQFLTVCLISLILLPFSSPLNVEAAPFKKISAPPLTEQWYGIYVDNEQVGFYRQKISSAPGGYQIVADGSVKMKIMGFSKEATTRESYFVSKSLALKSFDVEQTINASSSRVTGSAGDSVLRLTSESNGTKREKQIKVKGEIFPGAALNILPVIRDTSTGKAYKVMMFDPEELKVKEIKISVIGETTAPDGTPALKLRNNLYPFVNNDVWVDGQGQTLMESVRDGLVVTKLEKPQQLGRFVGNLALSKKDLIYDFSMIRVSPPLTDISKIKGLTLEIAGWNDDLPLFQSNFQKLVKKEPGILTVQTGSSFTATEKAIQVDSSSEYLQPADKIESSAPQIIKKTEELLSGKKDTAEKISVLAAWTAEWLKDTVDDGGSAVESFNSRSGNCQTHSRLYTALARAAGIPTRFVSGLVYQEKLGFLYHSWAESLINSVWTPVDPTFNQSPADPTHIKLFEGHRPEDMTPIISIIGRIKVKLLNMAPPQTPLPVADQKTPA